MTLEAVAELSEDLDAELAAGSIVDPRTIPVRFSNLKHMSLSALHYHDACQTDREQTIAMRFGAGVHAMVLEQPFVVWHGKDRRAAGYKKFAEDHADVPILTRKEHAVSSALAKAILAHPIAAPLLFDAGAIIEQTIAWQWGGRSCSSRPDSRRGSDVLVDLKTTQCAEPGKFERDATFRGYHAQLAFYEQAIEHETGTAPRESYIVAVESKRPHAITVMRLTDEARELGRRMVRTWFERLLVCEASNAWPAYTESVCQLGMIDSDYGITIDGVAFTEEQT